MELCQRPEYVELLREELQSHSLLNATTIADLPLLDSFMKETVRFSPADQRESPLQLGIHSKYLPESIRRKALKPFTFSNGGPHVPLGSVACVSSWDILHDPSKYPNPYDFNPKRFEHADSPDGNHARRDKFTNISDDFPMWGFGTRAWYVEY